MEEAQKAQILYLRQDMKLLNNVLESVKSETSAPSQDSLQHHHDVSDVSPYITNLGYYFVFDGEKQIYVSTLELMLNQLFKIIDELTSYSSLGSKEVFVQSRNVLRPKFIMLGNILEKLWNNVRDVKKLAKSKKCKVLENDISLIFLDKETQTVETTKERCDSCHIAETYIKQISHLLRNNEYNTRVEPACLEVEDLFCMTQQGIMLRITNSLQNDLSAIFNVIRSKNEENEILKQERNKSNKDLSDEKNFSSTLMSENTILEKELSENESTIASLKDERDGLQRENSELKIQLDTVKNQSVKREEAMKKYEALVINYQNEINRLKSSFNAEKRSLYDNCTRKIEMLEANINGIDADIIELIESLTSVASSMDVLCETTDIISRTCNGIESRVADLIDKCSLSNYVETLFNKCQDVANLPQNKVGVNHLKSHSALDRNATDFIIKGDPLTDMAQQIETNKKQMERLAEQNVKLENVMKILRKPKSSKI